MSAPPAACCRPSCSRARACRCTGCTATLSVVAWPHTCFVAVVSGVWCAAATTNDALCEKINLGHVPVAHEPACRRDERGHRAVLVCEALLQVQHFGACVHHALLHVDAREQLLHLLLCLLQALCLRVVLLRVLDDFLFVLLCCLLFFCDQSCLVMLQDKP